MQAVILAAGRGVRMGEMTREIPKPLLPVAGKTVLQRTFTALPQEINEVILVVGYLGEQIQKRYGHQHGRLKLRYVKQKELRGTGYALKICQRYLKDRFIVCMGDDLYSAHDIVKCLKHELCLLAAEIEYKGKGGVLKMDKQGRLLEVIESPKKPPSNLINTGFYVLDKRFFDYPLAAYENHDGKTEYGLPQTVALMAREHPVYIERASRWFKVTYSEDIKKAEEWLRKRDKREIIAPFKQKAKSVKLQLKTKSFTL